MHVGADAEVRGQLGEQRTGSAGCERRGKIGKPGGFAEAPALRHRWQTGLIGAGVGIGLRRQTQGDTGTQYRQCRQQKSGERLNLKDGACQS